MKEKIQDLVQNHQKEYIIQINQEEMEFQRMH